MAFLLLAISLYVLLLVLVLGLCHAAGLSDEMFDRELDQ